MTLMGKYTKAPKDSIIKHPNADSKFYQVGRKVLQSRTNMNAVNMFMKGKDTAASRVTRKAGQLSDYQQNKLMKCIENNQD